MPPKGLYHNSVGRLHRFRNQGLVVASTVALAAAIFTVTFIDIQDTSSMESELRYARKSDNKNPRPTPIKQDPIPSQGLVTLETKTDVTATSPVRAENVHTNFNADTRPERVSKRDAIQLFKLESQSQTDLAWITESSYWNPTEAKLNESQLTHLRRHVASGQELLQSLSKANSNANSKVLHDAINAGTASRLTPGSPIPTSSGGSYYISISSAQGIHALELSSEGYPEVWNSRRALELQREMLHDSIFEFFSRNSK